MNFLRVKNWEEFQQYKDRDPKWIKVHRDLLYDYEMDRLDEIAQLHLLKIWLLAAKLDNKIPNDAEWIARQIGAKSKVNIKQLCTFGFLIAYESVQACTETYLETETETYKQEAEKEIDSAQRASKQKRGTRIPENWQPSDELRAWSVQEKPGIDIKRVIDSFTDYWRSAAGAKGVKLDWDATWRNWIRNDRTNPQHLAGKAAIPENRIERSDRKIREALAECEAQESHGGIVGTHDGPLRLAMDRDIR